MPVPHDEINTVKAWICLHMFPPYQGLRDAQPDFDIAAPSWGGWFRCAGRKTRYMHLFSWYTKCQLLQQFSSPADKKRGLTGLG